MRTECDHERGNERRQEGKDEIRKIESDSRTDGSDYGRCVFMDTCQVDQGVD